ncbi:hypothetical protein BRC81_03470 [Halobacteriales archaeon QS_1_68_20]|nr:MAG: hypothetical protein BRC81_03470 [Halobacteriales archaeon QS_1_68_20]
MGDVDISYRGGDDARSVADRLEELKEQGCVAVATGGVPTDAMQSVTRRMFGDPTLDRRRLFVTFGQVSRPADWLPEDLTTDHETVVFRDRSDGARVATTQSTEQDGRPGPPDAASFDPAKPHLDAVTGDVLDVADELPARGPGRLRVVVLRPDHLLDERQRGSAAPIEEFVDRLRILMQRFGGMGLLVVSKPDDDGLVEALLDVVDLQFRVRKEWSFVEQQVVIDPGARDPFTTGWHELP